jgi:hypothetical protein
MRVAVAVVIKIKVLSFHLVEMVAEVMVLLVY